MNHRQAGHQREAATSDGQQDGIRNADLPGDNRQERDRDETNAKLIRSCPRWFVTRGRMAHGDGRFQPRYIEMLTVSPQCAEGRRKVEALGRLERTRLGLTHERWPH